MVRQGQGRMRNVRELVNGSCDVYVQSTIKWRRSKTEIAAMDLDLAFGRSDTTILYKRHITHENKAVSYKSWS